MASISKLLRRGAPTLLAIPLLGSCAVLLGNDSAVAVGAGGLQLRKEARISMEKERLTISLKKVIVEYEFLNTTDQEVTTKVAFPIPPYEMPEEMGGPTEFSDFRVWVEGREVKYQTDVRAKHEGADYTNVLRGLGVNIRTFGYVGSTGKNQLDSLPKSAKEDLIRRGLMDAKHGWPEWLVALTYYWNQRFPAHKALHVRHEYRPVVGFAPDYEPKEFEDMLREACVDPSLRKRLGEFPTQRVEEEGAKPPYRHAEMVKYILTTANTWRTPIRDFELVIEEPDPSSRDPHYLGLSVCWDGELRRVDKNHFVARKTGFIPKRDLVVCFFDDYYNAGLDVRLK
jgi:hypothetical protein